MTLKKENRYGYAYWNHSTDLSTLFGIGSMGSTGVTFDDCANRSGQHHASISRQCRDVEADPLRLILPAGAAISRPRLPPQNMDTKYNELFI
jgi:hypothetical protein